jgi:hypothetical protein
VTRRMLVLLVGLSPVPTLAQMPEPLPPTVLEPVVLKPAGPLSPAEAARQRESLIKNLKENLVTFDAGAVQALAVDGHWQLRTATEVLKDFGPDRGAAIEAARFVKELRVNQVGTVKGSNPPFEYWLADGKPPRVLNARAIVLPVAGRSIHAEQVGGAWVVSDGSKSLHDFGADADAAQRAATVYWKYGFNQLAVVGGPQPAMLVPLTDPAQAEREKSAPVHLPSPIGVLGDVSKTSLLLPGNVYAGPKVPIDPAKLAIGRREGGTVVLTHGNDVLARFGGNEMDARAAMRALQDARVTEMARIGSTGFPLFLANGQPIPGEPLGATRMSIRADRLKVQKIRDTWWVNEDSRPLVEAGTRDDAELLVRVMKYFDFRTVCVLGRAETGGLRLLTMGR